MLHPRRKKNGRPKAPGEYRCLQIKGRAAQWVPRPTVLLADVGEGFVTVGACCKSNQFALV